MSTEKVDEVNEKFASALTVVLFMGLAIAIMIWALIKFALTSPGFILGLKAFSVPFAGVTGTVLILCVLICADGRRIRNR